MISLLSKGLSRVFSMLGTPYLIQEGQGRCYLSGKKKDCPGLEEKVDENVGEESEAKQRGISRF